MKKKFTLVQLFLPLVLLVLVDSAQAALTCHELFNSKVDTLWKIIKSNGSKAAILSHAKKLNLEEKKALLQKKFPSTLFTNQQLQKLDEAHLVGRESGYFRLNRKYLRQKIQILKAAKFNLTQRNFILRTGLAGEISEQGYIQIERALREVETYFNIYSGRLNESSEIAILDLINFAENYGYLRDENDRQSRVESLVREGVPQDFAQALIIHLFQINLSHYKRDAAYKLSSYLNKKIISFPKGILTDHALADLYEYWQSMNFEFSPHDSKPQEILQGYGLNSTETRRILDSLSSPNRFLSSVEKTALEEALREEGIYSIDRKLESILVYVLDKYGPDMRMDSREQAEIETKMELMEIFPSDIRSFASYLWKKNAN